MAIKKLQNNYTTPEQSKRLLELGVPADSADCFYGYNDDYVYVLYKKQFSVIKDIEEHITPCWSAGRLIETMLNSQIETGTYEQGFMLDKETFNIEFLIDIIDEESSEFDFSRLEE